MPTTTTCHRPDALGWLPDEAPARMGRVTLRKSDCAFNWPAGPGTIGVYKSNGNWDVYEFDNETGVVGRYLRTHWVG